MKILIIEDEFLMREAIARVLRTRNWDVIQASDGETGLVLARSQMPDLIICDFEMEGLNGFQTLARLREHDATATIPFIMLTGEVERASARHTMDLGADDYLAKPLKPDELLRCVDARIARSRLNREQTAQKLAALRASIMAALPHEFKTPLNGILGFADLLVTDLDAYPREEVRAMLQDIRTSAGRLERLVDRFLACTELSMRAAEASAEQRMTVVADPASELETIARQVAGRHLRPTDLTLCLTAGRPAITSAHWGRLVEELIDNAFKFSSRGTMVVAAGGESAGRYTLEVADAGRGMAAEQLADAGAFLQFDRKRLEQPGVGLGLATARLLTELNDGNIAWRSAPGSGTTVIVTLPLTEGRTGRGHGLRACCPNPEFD